MSRRKMTEGKERIIAGLLEEYDIKSGNDIENALKNLLGGTIESMLRSELDSELGYGNYERNSTKNARNGYKSKTLKSTYGEILIEVPQDRNGDFEPKVVKKRQKDISGIEEKIISMYASGLTIR